jgi:pyridoxamine 5'-phosphate oxidase
MRDYLRALPVFADELPDFDPSDASEQPHELFVSWLIAAVEAKVREPHAMTLSTIGENGIPSARVLILKDVDERGWQFAVHAASPKGRQLERNPGAALTFYWPVLSRQIRIRGPVRPEPAHRSAADFLARPPASRAEAALGRQSQPLSGRDTAARPALPADAVIPEWTLYNLAADEVEFWQADQNRKHTRLRYTRTGTGWARGLLWP